MYEHERWGQLLIDIDSAYSIMSVVRSLSIFILRCDNMAYNKLAAKRVYLYTVRLTFLLC